MRGTLVNLNVNPCKMCMPLGAITALYGIKRCISILHGSQGCSTYIRRHMATHYNEPVDIASSSLTEEGTVYGGEKNLIQGLLNLIKVYEPEVIGVATTCLAETIGEDIVRFIDNFRSQYPQYKHITIIPVSSAGYAGTQSEGFSQAIYQIVKTVPMETDKHHKVNIITSQLSPADTRYLKELLEDYEIDYILLPDLSDNLDGIYQATYHKLPSGGTDIEEIRKMAGARMTIELSSFLEDSKSAAKYLSDTYGVPYIRCNLPVSLRDNDALIEILQELSGKKASALYTKERGRFLDAMIDAHKYNAEANAIVYGEPDFVYSTVRLCVENGIMPIVAATGTKCVKLKEVLQQEIKDLADTYYIEDYDILDDIDFQIIEELARKHKVNLMIGNSDGRRIADKLGMSLVRRSFPIHDRMGGQRLRMLGYEGALTFLDEISNAILGKKETQFREELFNKYYQKNDKYDDNVNHENQVHKKEQEYKEYQEYQEYQENQEYQDEQEEQEEQKELKEQKEQNELKEQKEQEEQEEQVKTKSNTIHTIDKAGNEKEGVVMEISTCTTKKEENTVLSCSMAAENVNSENSVHKTIEEKTASHPCYNCGAHTNARIHLPIAPKCNISCNYCLRKYDCPNESRPGVTTSILKPEEAYYKFLEVKAKVPNLTVVGIAGPGDALANFEETKKTLELIRQADSNITFCLSTNGLMLPHYAEELIHLGVSHVTVTMNTIDPAIGAKIYKFVDYMGVMYFGEAAATLLLANQLAGIKMLTSKGIVCKVNIVMLKGINDRHIPEVVAKAKELGAAITNIMSFLPVKGSTFEELPPTTDMEVVEMRIRCKDIMKQMYHCKQCRADAIGTLREDRSREFRATEKIRLQVAVATKSGMLVDQHFGQVTEFYVYEYKDGDAIFKERRAVQKYCDGAMECGTKEDKIERIIQTISDCNAVITMRIGEAPKQELSQKGIRVFTTCDRIEASIKKLGEEWNSLPQYASH